MAQGSNSTNMSRGITPAVRSESAISFSLGDPSRVILIVVVPVPRDRLRELIEYSVPRDVLSFRVFSSQDELVKNGSSTFSLSPSTHAFAVVELTVVTSI